VQTLFAREPGDLAIDRSAIAAGPHREGEEPSGLDRRGAGGAKGRGQGECEPAKHVPDSEPGKGVTGAGAHTASRNETLCRQIPKVGAECSNGAARFCAGGAQ
jgi:hypothetical protein